MTHVTIPADDNTTTVVVGASSAGPFEFDFPFFEDSEIRVVGTDADGVVTEYIAADFTVTGDDQSGTITGGYIGGEITLDAAVENTTLRIYRQVTVARVTDFPLSGPFNINLLNTELDRIIAIAQDLESQLDRMVVLPAGDTDPIDPVPAKAARAGRIFYWDADGHPAVSTLTEEELAEQAVIAEGFADAAAASAAAAAAAVVELQALTNINIGRIYRAWYDRNSYLFSRVN